MAAVHIGAPRASSLVSSLGYGRHVRNPAAVRPWSIRICSCARHRHSRDGGSRSRRAIRYAKPLEPPAGGLTKRAPTPCIAHVVIGSGGSDHPEDILGPDRRVHLPHRILISLLARLPSTSILLIISSRATLTAASLHVPFAPPMSIRHRPLLRRHWPRPEDAGIGPSLGLGRIWPERACVQQPTQPVRLLQLAK